MFCVCWDRIPIWNAAKTPAKISQLTLICITIIACRFYTRLRSRAHTARKPIQANDSFRNVIQTKRCRRRKLTGKACHETCRLAVRTTSPVPVFTLQGLLARKSVLPTMRVMACVAYTCGVTCHPQTAMSCTHTHVKAGILNSQRVHFPADTRRLPLMD